MGECMNWYKQDGLFWIWIGKTRIYVKDTRKQKPLFSERQGIGCKRIGPYIISVRRRDGRQD